MAVSGTQTSGQVRWVGSRRRAQRGNNKNNSSDNKNKNKNNSNSNGNSDSNNNNNNNIDNNGSDKEAPAVNKYPKERNPFRRTI